MRVIEITAQAKPRFCASATQFVAIATSRCECPRLYVVGDAISRTERQSR